MSPIKPHWAWFLAAPAVLMLGGVAAAAVLIFGTLSVSEGMQRVGVPGEGVVVIEEAGETTIFYEQNGVSQATIPEGLSVEVMPESGGASLPLSGAATRFTYANNDVAGRNFRNVTFPAPGRYRVVTSLPEGSTARGQIALGGNPGGALIGTLGGFFGIGALSFILCLTIVIVVAVKRSSYARRMREQQFQQMPPVPPAW